MASHIVRVQLATERERKIIIDFFDRSTAMLFICSLYVIQFMRVFILVFYWCQKKKEKKYGFLILSMDTQKLHALAPANSTALHSSG